MQFMMVVKSAHFWCRPVSDIVAILPYNGT